MSESMLSERINALAEEIPAPPVASMAADDVRRGRRRLRRRRLVGAGATVLAVGGVTGLVLGTAGPPRATPVPDPAPASSAGAQLAPQVEELVRARSDGTVTLDQLRSVTEEVEDELNTGRTRVLRLGTSNTWVDAGADQCPVGWECRDADVRGASRAKVASNDTTTQIAVEFPEEVVILTLTRAVPPPVELPFRDRGPDDGQLRPGG